MTNQSFMEKMFAHSNDQIDGIFSTIAPPLVPRRELPPLLCYTLPQFYLAYSLDSRISV